jgi:STIMATE family
MIYFLGLMGMKLCVLTIFLALPWISRIGDWALRWTEGNEHLQVFFVMLFFPVVMNATQYYIIDSFIKNQKLGEMEVLPSDDGESDDGTDDSDPFDDPTLLSDEDMDSEDEELPKKEAVDIKANGKPETKDDRGSGLKDRHNYDPQFDGESSPTVVGSASNSERMQLLGKDEDSEVDVKAGRP